jgi:hypothetical protein
MKRILIPAAIFVFVMYSSFGFSGAGSGTEADPYQITTLEQLREMNDDLDAHYILMNDIDASATRNWNVGDHDENPATPDSAMGWEPVGSYTKNFPKGTFRGSLSGQNHSINNLYISRKLENNIGLFGVISGKAEIKSLKLQYIYILGYNHIGSLAGQIYQYKQNDSLVIKDIKITGEIIGNNEIGGFAGLIENSYSGIINISNVNCDISITGKSQLGGFTYEIESSESIIKINNCHVAGKILSEQVASGFITTIFTENGRNRIENCGFEGEISCDNFIGGFSRYQVAFGGISQIEFCYSKFLISSLDGEYTNDVSGFISDNSGTSNHGNAIISNCFAKGDIGDSRSSGVSGFCRYNNSGNIKDCRSIIENCYYFGILKGRKSFLNKDSPEFCNQNLDTNNVRIINSYWNSDALTGVNENNAKPLKPYQMKSKDSYHNWDFENIWDISPEINDGLPFLRNYIADKLPRKQIDDFGILIYPNPASDFITVQIEEGISQVYTIEILNFSDGIAKFVYAGMLEFIYKVEIPVTDLASGIYFLRVNTFEWSKSYPIVIN